MFDSTLTVQAYLNEMDQAIGQTADARLDRYALLNQAGRRLFTCAMTREFGFHSWTWTLAGPTPIELKAGQSWALLPEDFKGIDGATIAGLTKYRVDVVSMGRLQQLRNYSVVRSLSICMCFEGQPRKVDSKLAPRRVVEVWPTPDADRSDIELVYRRGWSTVESGDLGRTVDIPAEWEGLLTHLAREAVFTKEFRRPYPSANEIRAEIERLVGLDSMTQGEYGEQVHSVKRSAKQRVPDFEIDRVEKV